MRRLHKIFLGIIFAVLLSVNTGLVQPVSAALDPGGGGSSSSAAYYTTLSTIDQVRVLDRYRAFLSCLESGPIFPNLAQEPIHVSGTKIGDPTSWTGGSSGGTVAIGYSNDPDGKAECKNVTAPAITDLGYGTGAAENVKFLEGLGFKLNTSNNYYEFSGSESDLQNRYRALVQSKLGINPETLFSKGSTIYQRAFYAATNRCKITVNKPLSEWTTLDENQNPNPKTILYTNPTTKKVEKYVIDYDTTVSGWDKDFDYFEKLDGEPRRVNCNDLLGDLNNPAYANDYQSYVNANTTANTGGLNASAGGTAGTAANERDDCPLPEDAEMRWFGCSIMTSLQGVLDKLYGSIQQFLYTPTSSIFDNPALKKSAAGLRNLALALIIVAGLVMVIAQATGSDLVDAYTIRKLLPRLGVAVIGIALSWPLLRLAIVLTNDIGLMADGILEGVTQAGQNGGGSESDFGTYIGNFLFASAAVIGGTTYAVLSLGVTGTMALGGMILLALFIGLLVLAIRQLVIMACIILAPLAIAAYVLPGTQKLWAFWKNTFMTSLIMFPIIMFFLASGRVFASILGGANSSTATLLAIIVFIAPYFLLPFAFKLAGGLMATVFSIANDKSRGGFDRLKKRRRENTAKRHADWRSGSLGEGTMFNSAYNRLGVNSAGTRLQAGMRGRFGVGTRGRAAVAVNAGIAANQALKENPQLQQFAMTNDEGNAVLALSGGTAAGAQAAARDLFGDTQQARDAYAAASAIGFSRRNATAALSGLAQNKSRAIRPGRTDQVRRGIERLAGGNNQLNDDLVGTFAYYSRGAGRADLGGMNWGLVGQREEYDTRTDELARRYALLADGTQGPVTEAHFNQAAADVSMLDGVGRTKVHEVIGGHTAAMRQSVEGMGRMLVHGSDAEKEKAAVHLLEFAQNINGASADNQAIINAGLADLGVDMTDETTIANQLVAIAGTGATAGYDARSISRQARTYGEDVPPGERRPPEIPTTTPPEA